MANLSEPFEMRFDVSSSKPTQRVSFSNTVEMISDPELDDLEVKSFFLLLFTCMGFLPDLLTSAFFVQVPLAIWLVSISLLALDHFSDSAVIQAYIDDWKKGVWMLAVTVFGLGMALSRLTVLLLWMLWDVCQWVLVFCLALVLTALALVWEAGAERCDRVRGAAKEASDNLGACSNLGEVFEYVAS